MHSREAAKGWADGPAPLAATATWSPASPTTSSSSRTASLLWATVASTSHRIRRGEGALLAINLSLIVAAQPGLAEGLALALVSLLTIAQMYAFNDFFDAATDVGNPKKDPALIAAYLDDRPLAAASNLALMLTTVAIAYWLADPRVALAAAISMTVNLVYSTVLKGVPIADVAWCGVWGAAYAALVSVSLPVWAIVALMTAVCHLFQALDDRAADAAHAINTTAVRSAALSRNVLVVLSLLLFLVLTAPLGTTWAMTAFVPLAIHLVWDEPRTGWLLTKAYFGILWLALLGIPRALG